jgi:hypothetical protein
MVLKIAATQTAIREARAHIWSLNGPRRDLKKGQKAVAYALLFWC